MTTHPPILVADDDDVVRQVVVQLLRRLVPGAQVVAVADGTQALAAIQHTGFGLVITDYHMPGASGLDVLLAARARDPAVPVIVASAQHYLEPSVLAAGATAFLPKPFTVEQLAALLRQLLP